MQAIVQVLAQHGHDVVMRDLEESFVAKGLSLITKNLDKLAAKEKITVEAKTQALSRIKNYNKDL